jgi:hypothetical protein
MREKYVEADVFVFMYVNLRLTFHNHVSRMFHFVLKNRLWVHTTEV